MVYYVCVNRYLVCVDNGIVCIVILLLYDVVGFLDYGVIVINCMILRLVSGGV